MPERAPRAVRRMIHRRILTPRFGSLRVEHTFVMEVHEASGRAHGACGEKQVERGVALEVIEDEAQRAFQAKRRIAAHKSSRRIFGCAAQEFRHRVPGGKSVLEGSVDPPPAVTGDTMPAASPTSSARDAATGATIPPQGINPARTPVGAALRKSMAGAIFSRSAAIASLGFHVVPVWRRARPACTPPTPASTQPTETTWTS